MIKDVPRIGVLMCFWQRLHLLKRTLDQLMHQQWVEIDFYIWNNNFQLRDDLNELVSPYRSRLNISVWHSPTNVGCFGRFFYAKQLRQSYPFLVVIDDDQEFDDWFVRQLWDEKIAGGVTACHAFRFTKDDDYWNRQRPEAGESVTYCGPGGMILDSCLMDHPKFFACPSEYWLIDDLWLSYVFHHLMRFPMKKASPIVTMTDKANDTFHSLREKKSKFLTDLRRIGWQV